MNKYQLVKNTEWKEVEINGEIKEIPQDWEIKSVLEVSKCLDNKRKPLNQSERSNKKGNIPYWGANNIVDYVNDYLVDEEVVLLGEDAAPFYDKTKKVAFFSNEKIWPNNHIHVLKPLINSYFLMTILNAVQYEKIIGTESRPKLTQVMMNSIEFSSPSANEQSAIANILSNQESIVQNIESLIAKYESRFQYLSEELLSGRLRVKEVDGQLTLYKNLEDNWKEVEVNGEIKDIPQDWNVDKLKNHILVINGYAFPKSKMLNEKIHNSLPIIKIGNIQDNIIIENSGTGQNYYSGLIKEIFIPQYNDLIIGLSGANAGKTGIYKILNQTALNQRNAIVRIKSDQISQDFFNYFWFKDALNVLKETTKDSAIPNISSDDIEIIDFFILNKTEQSNIAKLLSQQEDLINQQKQLLTKEKQKFDWLLDNLLSGKYLIKENNMDFKIANTIEEQNEWFKECQKKQIYYIYITERDKYAKINWDHISLNLSIEQELDEIHQPEREKLDGLIDLFMRHMNPRDKDNHKLPATYNGSTLVGYFDNIPKEKAHELAQDLANYLNGIVKNYINQPKI